MSALSTSAAASTSGRWRHAALRFLALSAAVSHDVLETRNADGSYRYHRGRHKYYGIGSLVIFFAIFSGYGMGHMLATMSTISLAGAVMAGIIWAVFQWCLERQMLISIHAQAAWWQKLFGIGWRGVLALLSASTMVYPFFVESNRAEIDIKVGEVARARMIDNVQSAALAVGLPSLREDAMQIETSIKAVDIALASEPQEIGFDRLKARQCWQSIRKQEESITRQMRALQTSLNGNPLDSYTKDRIEVLSQRLVSTKAPCKLAESLVLKRLIDWKKEKSSEKRKLLDQQQQLGSEIGSAKQKQQELSQSQDRKIQSAATSGFAADFAAVAELVQHDGSRRFQLIWWLIWFFLIEMVAIMVKFTSSTDVDWHLQSIEKQQQNEIANDLQTQLDQLATQAMRESMATKGRQSACLADDGQLAAALFQLEEQLFASQQRQRLQLQTDLEMNFETLKMRLSQLEAIRELARESKVMSEDIRIEQMFKEAIENVLARSTGRSFA